MTFKHTAFIPQPGELEAALKVIRKARAKKTAKRKRGKLKTNTLYLGDNLEVLKSIPDESVDLIYLDPPFATGDEFGFTPQKNQLTPQLIHAIGWDAGNKSAAKAGRKVWNHTDYNRAARFALKLAREHGLDAGRGR